MGPLVLLIYSVVISQMYSRMNILIVGIILSSSIWANGRRSYTEDSLIGTSETSPGYHISARVESTAEIVGWCSLVISLSPFDLSVWPLLDTDGPGE